MRQRANGHPHCEMVSSILIQRCVEPLTTMPSRHATAHWELHSSRVNLGHLGAAALILPPLPSRDGSLNCYLCARAFRDNLEHVDTRLSF